MEHEFYNKIARELGGVHENLKDMCREMKEIKEQLIVVNSRTRKLEDWKLIIKTQTGMIAVIVSGAVGIVIWAFSLFFE